MTLLEVMVATGILSVVIAVVFSLALSTGDTARVQHARTTAHDEARRALQSVVRELRQAARSSISALPASVITYRAATDLDGNGTAVDVGCTLELSAPRTITPDYDDANGDGVLKDQLVLINGETVSVLANGLFAQRGDEATGSSDGIWFESQGDGLRITVTTFQRSRKGLPIPATLSEFVAPRN